MVCGVVFSRLIRLVLVCLMLMVVCVCLVMMVRVIMSGGCLVGIKMVGVVSVLCSWVFG